MYINFFFSHIDFLNPYKHYKLLLNGTSFNCVCTDPLHGLKKVLPSGGEDSGGRSRGLGGHRGRGDLLQLAVGPVRMTSRAPV